MLARSPGIESNAEGRCRHAMYNAVACSRSPILSLDDLSEKYVQNIDIVRLHSQQ